MIPASILVRTGTVDSGGSSKLAWRGAAFAKRMLLKADAPVYVDSLYLAGLRLSLGKRYLWGPSSEVNVFVSNSFGDFEVVGTSTYAKGHLCQEIISEQVIRPIIG